MAKKVVKQKKATKAETPAKEPVVSTPAHVPSRVPSRTAAQAGTLQAASALIDAQSRKEMIAATESRAFRQHRLFTRIVDLDLFSPIICGQRAQIVGQPGVGKSLLLMIIMAAMQRTCRLCYTPIITWVDDWRFLKEIPDEKPEVTRQRRAEWVVRHERWVHGDKTAFNHQTTCACGANERMRVLFFNTELSFDPMWAAIWGVDVGDFDRYDRQFSDSKADGTWGGLITREDNGLTICQPSSSAVFTNVVEAMIKTNAVDAIVIDSITSLAVTEDLDGKERTASHARFLSRLWPLMLSWQLTSNTESGSKIPIVMTNQFRQTMASYPGANPNMASSGMAQQYAVDMTINLVRSQKNSFSEKKLETVLTRDLEMRLDKYRGSILGQSSVRVVVRDHETTGGVMLRAGSTNESEKVLAYLKELKNPDVLAVEKSGTSIKRYWVLGRPFDRLKDVLTFLGRDDVLYRIRYILAAHMFSDVGLFHIRALNFDYSPFEDHIGGVIKSLSTKTGESYRQVRQHAIDTGADRVGKPKATKDEKPE